MLTDRLDFWRLHAELVAHGAADDDAAGQAADLAARGPSGWVGLCTAVAAPDVRGEDLPRLVGWVRRTALDWLVLSVRRSLSAVPAAPSATARDTVGSLAVAPELEHLPLLDLAADLAESRVNGLTVAVAAPGPGAVGFYDPTRSVIVVDPASSDLAVTFAHELGHALDDPVRLASPTSEDFADALGALLLAHRPATVLAARPLIDQAETAHHPATTPDLPTRGLEAMATWLLGFSAPGKSPSAARSANRVPSQISPRTSFAKNVRVVD